MLSSHVFLVYYPLELPNIPLTLTFQTSQPSTSQKNCSEFYLWKKHLSKFGWTKTNNPASMVFLWDCLPWQSTLRIHWTCLLRQESHQWCSRCLRSSLCPNISVVTFESLGYQIAIPAGWKLQKVSKQQSRVVKIQWRPHNKTRYTYCIVPCAELHLNIHFIGKYIKRKPAQMNWAWRSRLGTLDWNFGARESSQKVLVAGPSKNPVHGPWLQGRGAFSGPSLVGRQQKWKTQKSDFKVPGAVPYCFRHSRCGSLAMEEMDLCRLQSEWSDPGQFGQQKNYDLRDLFIDKFVSMRIYMCIYIYITEPEYIEYGIGKNTVSRAYQELIFYPIHRIQKIIHRIFFQFWKILFRQNKFRK